MFTGKLFDFQILHEEKLLKNCAIYKEQVLCAPTGSGKTVLACKFIEDYLDENPNTVFLWLCPGAGGLQKQAQESFKELMTGIDDGDVYSFISEINPRGNVYFINWDKINKSSNVVLREGEHKDLMARVKECHRQNIEIFMIIDEEHKYRETAMYFQNEMVPGHVLRISATPITDAEYTETITDDEVIASGLITSSISINEGVSKAIEENNNMDDDLLLIKLADKKRIQIQNEYKKLGLNIRPLVLIQFPNGQSEWIDRVKNCLDKLGYSEKSGMVSCWFSGDHPDNPEEIVRLNGHYSFLLFKQAIATGWDCPRAKILVKLREGGTDSFKIQTIGRIRRMPQRIHYDNEILDRCYVYTLDNQFKEGLTNEILNSFYSYNYKAKSHAPFIKLTKESLDGSDRFAVNPEAVVKVIRERMLKSCDVDYNGELQPKEMEITQGYTFGTILKTSAIEGVARTTKDIQNLNKIFGGEHEIDNHEDGFIIRDAKRKIARAIGIDENISNNALRILFGPQDKQLNIWSQSEFDFEKENKLLKNMSLREYNAFLVNNKEKLVEVFEDVSVNEIADIQEVPLINSEWSIPGEQYYKQHKKIASTKYYEKNVYENYGNNILINPNRSYTEIQFEEWCEHYNPVKWVYKNGDKGDEYFSIVYRRAFRRNNFYPDYIIQLQNGEVWIIEAKGGESADGTSKNIDSYAKNKFGALKKYAQKHSDVKWGFVRAIGTQLYMSNTEWDENVTNRNVWKPIEVFIQE